MAATSGSAGKWEIVAYDADVEVDHSHYLRHFQPLAQAAGYGTLYLPRGWRTPAGPDFKGTWKPHPMGPPIESDGVMLLYKRSRLRLLAVGGGRMSDWVSPQREQQEYGAEMFWDHAVSGQGGICTVMALLQLRRQRRKPRGGAGAAAAAIDVEDSDATTDGSGSSSGGEGEAQVEVEVEGVAKGGGADEEGRGVSGRGCETPGALGAGEWEESDGEEEWDEWGERVQPSGAGAEAREAEAALAGQEERRGMNPADCMLSAGVTVAAAAGDAQGSPAAAAEPPASAASAAISAAARRGRLFCVANTHLWYDPKVPDRKLAEAQSLCRAVAGFMAKHGLTEPQAVPLVLCGDLNTTWARYRTDKADVVAPGGCLVGGVYELLSRGCLGAEHPHHPARLRRPTEDMERLSRLRFDTAGKPRGGGQDTKRTCGLRLPGSQMVANGREPPATIRTGGFRGGIDYVFVSRGHWAVSCTLDMPYRYGRDPRTDELDKDAKAQREEAERTAAEQMAAAGQSYTCGGRSAQPPRPAGGGAAAALPPAGPGVAAAAATAPPVEAEAAMAAADLELGMAGRGPVWDLSLQPNPEWPSDHLAVGAELLLLPPRRRLL
ncbi:CCR4-NOT transcription complex subunit 6-like [Tetrabaena socialis]|uniref:CCR4-NOT transcription complex subunit 6-like n=1 Tax=Tetrabaena socialis TaxID=47790 RepID=A0A2J8AH54_9CHLO|nr:CCR4-NOT transcription complex subunit 6-like [Tetrabaena socialis]|eukprot:PNH11849.1 CCR4-NOT transcription complex subunit 6-like [Tetrabaena socialis]